MGSHLQFIVKIDLGNLTGSNNFHRGHPVVLIVTVITYEHRLTQHLLYVFA